MRSGDIAEVYNRRPSVPPCQTYGPTLNTAVLEETEAYGETSPSFVRNIIGARDGNFNVT